MGNTRMGEYPDYNPECLACQRRREWEEQKAREASVIDRSVGQADGDWCS